MTHDDLSAAVLAGGRSRRMGTDKALLNVAGLTMLKRVLAAVSGECQEVMIVGDRPEYHCFGVRVVADDWPEAGALGGIASALRHSHASHVLCVACDMPLLSRWLIRAMAAEPRNYDVLVPVTNSIDDDAMSRPIVHPLHAIYSREALPIIERRIREGLLRAVDLVQELDARWCDEAWVRSFDPGLDSMMNVNTPAELLRAVQRIEELSEATGERH